MQTISDRWKRAIAQLNEAGGPWGKRGGGSGGGSGGSGGNGGGDGGGDGPPKNPWDLPPGGGKRPRKPGSASAADVFIEKMKATLSGNGGGGSGGGGGNPFAQGDPTKLIRNIMLGVLVLWVVFTSFHRIEPQQEGVVTRFGAYQGRLEPGIGMTLPSPIDSVQKVDVRAINTTNIPENDGANFILTGDQNIIDLAYSVRWDKSNPENYLFELANPDETIREVAESAMREVLSQISLSDAFGPARGLIEARVSGRMQILLNSYQSGVTIRGVAIKHAQPPADVVEAFNQVTVKQQEKQANINNATTYARQVVARAEGDAAAFDKVYEQYRLAPDVTRKRMYYDTMEQVLSNTDKTIVEPNAVAPYLPLGGMRARPIEGAPK
jgi:modulator of FtsH protease HflK